MRILDCALHLGCSKERSEPARACIRLEFATQVFDQRTVERVDSRRDYGERRVIALGRAQNIPLTVVYTDRVEVGGEFTRRIISARKSDRRERQEYEKATGKQGPGSAGPS